MNIMVKIVVIEKNGNLKETNVRKVSVDELYKKCGFKTSENFKERACWNVKIDGEEQVIKFFAKDMVISSLSMPLTLSIVSH